MCLNKEREDQKEEAFEVQTRVRLEFFIGTRAVLVKDRYRKRGGSVDEITVRVRRRRVVVKIAA